jgi:hypothetical protein
VNEFVILLQNAAGAGYVFLVAVAAVAIGMFAFDRPRRTRDAAQPEIPREQKAA